MRAWFNGELVAAEQVQVPVLSHSMGRGSAVFEVLDIEATDEGPVLFRLDAHVQRLFRSAEALHMKLPLTGEELCQAVRRTAHDSRLPAGAMKILAYFSRAEFGLIPRDPAVDVAIFAMDLPFIVGDRDVRAMPPVRVGVSPIRKLSPATVAVQAKAAGHYVNAYLARTDAAARGYDDAILLDQAGCLAEGTISNLFLVEGGVVRTSRLSSALAGITRDSVLAIVQHLRLPLEEADMPREAFQSADEAFLTGSVVRIQPIESVDDHEVGGACPGPITRRIRQAFNEACEGRLGERYAQWITRLP